MPQPTSQQVHLDAILTTMSIAYMQDLNAFIATKVFPVVPVQKQSDRYYIFDKQAFLRDDVQRRAPAEESAGSGYTVSRDGYYADVWALHKDIADQTRNNTDNPLNPDRNATQFLTQQMLQRQDRQFVTDFFTTGVWSVDMLGTTAATTPDATHFVQWSDQVSSDPINDIETGKESILSTTGFMPNKLVLGYSVFRRLKTHPDLVDRIKYTGGGGANAEKVYTEQMMADLFGLDEVLVARSVGATNVEGETAAYSFNFGKSALLCYSAPAPGIETPSAGYTFMWTGVSGNLGVPLGLSRFRLEWLKADRVEIEAAWANHVTGKDLGIFFSAASA